VADKTGLAQVKIEPVLDLAVEQVKKDIETTCEMLSISPDPCQWSTEDVRSWLFWTVQQFSIPMSLLNLDLWNMDGQAFVQLGEEDFKRRLPQGGDTIYSQFDIWRSSAGYEAPVHQLQQQTVPCHAPPPYQEPAAPPTPDHAQHTGQDNANSSTDNYMDIAYMLQMLDSHNNPVGAPQTHYMTPKQEPGLGLGQHQQLSPPPYPGSDQLSEVSTIVGSDTGVDPMDEDDDEEEEDSGKGSPSRPGTNIHLWQFIKELLLQPQHYGNFIHWLDRQKGIFKIVDSVKVATLWGKRKNRPAMNYDKLSRSLRQYYKKGIMKKTERSQRLVYQFCHPYHL
jgi:SAM pointed domain-containing ETS transcription factor